MRVCKRDTEREFVSTVCEKDRENLVRVCFDSLYFAL